MVRAIMTESWSLTWAPYRYRLKAPGHFKHAEPDQVFEVCDGICFPHSSKIVLDARCRKAERDFNILFLKCER